MTQMSTQQRKCNREERVKREVSMIGAFFFLLLSQSLNNLFRAFSTFHAQILANQYCSYLTVEIKGRLEIVAYENNFINKYS